jgi:hypothetical protein
MSSAAAVATSTPPTILPPRGIARVKNVMSGDTVVLLGSKPGQEVMFTMEQITAPRYDDVAKKACLV